jgi:hypothetical protein
MVDLHTLFLVAKATIAAHPDAVHIIAKSLSWAGKAVGFLRTLDWARNKYQALKSEKPQQKEEKRTAA